MQKQQKYLTTLKEFAKLHKIELSKTADTNTKGYAIHTGTVSLPSWYFVPLTNKT